MGPLNLSIFNSKEKADIKKLFIKLAILFALTILPLVIFNYVIDPEQYFRKAAFYRPIFDDNQRMQNPGLAKNYDYDTVIIGTSISDNFDLDYIDNKLRTKSLKLTLNGSTIFEQQLMLTFAIKTGKVKNVLWEISTERLYDNPQNYKKTLPYYLYDSSKINNILYLIEPYLFNVYIMYVENVFTKKFEDKRNPRTLNQWYSENIDSFKKDAQIAKYEKEIEENDEFFNALIDISEQNIKSNINENIVQIIKENPQIKFYLFFTPYNILYYSYMYKKHTNIFNKICFCKKFLVINLNQLKNVLIFDFENIKPVTFNLENYKDFRHFSILTNTFIVNAIADDKYRCNEKNIEANIADLINQVKTFDINSLKVK